MPAHSDQAGSGYLYATVSHVGRARRRHIAPSRDGLSRRAVPRRGSAPGSTAGDAGYRRRLRLAGRTGTPRSHPSHRQPGLREPDRGRLLERCFFPTSLEHITSSVLLVGVRRPPVGRIGVLPRDRGTESRTIRNALRVPRRPPRGGSCHGRCQRRNQRARLLGFDARAVSDLPNRLDAGLGRTAGRRR